MAKFTEIISQSRKNNQKCNPLIIIKTKKLIQKRFLNKNIKITLLNAIKKFSIKLKCSTNKNYYVSMASIKNFQIQRVFPYKWKKV